MAVYAVKWSPGYATAHSQVPDGTGRSPGGLSAKEYTVRVARRERSLGVHRTHCLVLHCGSCLTDDLSTGLDDAGWRSVERTVSASRVHHVDCRIRGTYQLGAVLKCFMSGS